MKFAPIRHFLRIAAMGLTMIVAVSACKSKQPSKGPAADINAPKKAECAANHGTWADTYCKCDNGYRQDQGNPNRCIENPKPSPSDCTGNTKWDATKGECVAIDANDPVNSKTARECFDRKGWWNGSVCSTTAPTTQDDCRKNGDNWTNNACQAIDPFNKSTVCSAGGGTWSDSGGCACQQGSTFDWNYYYRCVSGNQGGGGNVGQLPPDQSCNYGNGQWNGNYCVCPPGTVFDQNAARCMPDRGFTPYCPGMFNNQGFCFSSAGEQMLYSLLYGWIMQSLYLDDPNRPDSAKPEVPGDGH